MVLILRALGLCLLVLSALAQEARDFPPLRGNVATDASDLDVAAINEAAAGLREQGVRPLAIFLNEEVAGSLQDAEAFFVGALNTYGLAQGDSFQPELFAIFIGTAPLPESGGERPLFLAYGADLEPILLSSHGGPTLDERLRSDVMVPELLEGDFEAAFSAACAELERALASAEPVAVNTDSPQEVPADPVANPSAGLQLGQWALLLFAVIAVILLLTQWRQRVRRRSSTQHAADRALREVKGELSALLIDLSSADAKPGDAYLPSDMTQQSDMVLLGDLLESERPEDLRSLKTEYGERVTQLSDITRRFESLQKAEAGERREPDTLASYLEHYQDLLEETRLVEAFTLKLTQTFAGVEAEIASLAERRAALKTDLAQMSATYDEFRSANWPGREAVFSGAIENLKQADKLAAKQPLTALKKLNTAASQLSLVSDAARRLTQIEAQLAEYRQDLNSWRNEGFKLTDKDKHLSDLEQNVEVALGLLGQGEHKILDAQIDEVADLTQQLISSSAASVQLYTTNQMRLEELRRQGEQLGASIDAAASAFEALSGYAEASWRDVRGNGTEAQKAAERARDLFEDASELNRLDGAQAFVAARDAVEQGFKELAQAKQLTRAIHTRLDELRAAQATAREQLGLVSQDLRDRQELLSRPEVDRDVGEVAETMLQDAATLLTEAETNLAAERPNWLTALKQIQKADDLCDRALARIRDERSAMEHRRVRLASEKQEADAALARVMRYAEIHAADLESTTLETLRRAQTKLREAESAETRAASLTESALGAGLELAVRLFAEAEQLAERAFEQAEADFKAINSLRTQAAEAAGEASARFINLERLAARSGADVSRSLYALKSELPLYRADLRRPELESLLAEAKAFEQKVDALSAELEAHIEQRESALRRERERRLAEARRRQVAERSRRDASWGTWGGSPVIINTPRSPSYRRASRRMPVATRSSPVQLPSRSRGKVSGGSWGGSKGRVSGGGW